MSEIEQQKGEFSAKNSLPCRDNFYLYIKILSCRMDKLDVKSELPRELACNSICSLKEDYSPREANNF
jgi:hypothetical protein